MFSVCPCVDRETDADEKRGREERWRDPARKAAFGELQDRLIALPRPFLSQPTELVLWLHAELSRCAAGPLSLKRSCLTAGCAEQLGTDQLGAENSLSSVSYLRYRHFFFHRCQYNRNRFSQPMRRMVEPEGWWNQLWRRVPRLPSVGDGGAAWTRCRGWWPVAGLELGSEAFSWPRGPSSSACPRSA